MTEYKLPQIDTTQVIALDNSEFDLPIGRKVSLSLTMSGKTERFWSKFVGFEKQKYILLHLPLHPVNKKLPIGAELTVRYIKGNLICGFNTIVTGSGLEPVPLLMLQYPDQVELLNLRTKNRASCFFPASLFWESQEIKGRVLDISKGGFKIIALCSTNQTLPKLKVGTEVFAQIVMDKPEHTVYAKSLIRRITIEKNRYTFGLQFIDLPDEIQLAIDDYVEKILEYLEE